MIKLQDFAKQQGVTDRQVQRLLKKYELELEGLYERKGPNGTWLTEEACDILRSKMKQPPAPILYDEDPRVGELQERVRDLERQLSEKDKMLTISQQATQEAQNRVNLMLDEVQKVKSLEDKQNLLEGQIEALETDRDDWKDKAAKALEKAENASKERTEAKEYACALEEWTNLPWLKRIRTPKPVRENKE